MNSIFFQKIFIILCCIAGLLSADYTSAQNYLTLTALENSWVAVYNESNSPDINYSIDDGEWHHISPDMPVFLEKDSRMCFRGMNPAGFSRSVNNYTSIVISGNVLGSGSVMSLVDNTGTSVVVPAGYCFAHLFENSTGLLTPPNLPAVVLMRGCYSLMFAGCTRMTRAPRLLVGNLAPECYESMFMGCESITRIEVRFTHWAKFYDSMYGVDFYSTLSWVNGVGPNGLFVCPKGLPEWYGEDFIPEGWKVQYR